jgi:electron transport complex protein RnfC
VAGEIIGPCTATLTNGQVVQAIELKPVDVDQAAVERPAAPPESDRGGWIDHLRSAGVWADRWGSPNLLAQLNESLRRPVDTVVCSVLDGDPNLPIGAAMAVQETDNLISGVRQIARIGGAARATIVLQKRLLPGVVATLRRAGGLVAVEIVNDYPQADPTILLSTVLRRKLRPGRLPTEQGVLLLDAAAAVAVGRVVTSNTPMLTVPVAMFNHAHNTTLLAVAPVGASIDDLLEARRMPAGGFIFRGGDVLRNQRVPRNAVLAGGEIALHASPGPTPINPDPCIRCGWCVEACPSCIHPAGLLDASQRRDFASAEKYGLSACVECGLCDYVCPSRLPILNGIRMMRKE